MSTGCPPSAPRQPPASEHLDAPLCVWDRETTAHASEPRYPRPGGGLPHDQPLKHSQRTSQHQRSPGPKPLKEVPAPC